MSCNQFEGKLRAAAIDLFSGNKLSAEAWLNTPAKALGGRKPVDMTSSLADLESALDLVGRLQHGVFT